MAAAIEVARYIVQLAAEQEEPDALTPLRVQKLLYYAQGWHLAVYGIPLFVEPIEAWMHGPVVRDVYGYLSSHGNLGVDPAVIGAPQHLSEEHKTYLRGFWDSYRDFSAYRLYKATHTEQPWLDARKGVEPGERSNQRIPQEAMRDFFRAQLIPGLDPLASWKGLEDIVQGRVYSHEDVFAGLGSH